METARDEVPDRPSDRQESGPTDAKHETAAQSFGSKMGAPETESKGGYATPIIFEKEEGCNPSAGLPPATGAGIPGVQGRRIVTLWTFVIPGIRHVV